MSLRSKSIAISSTTIPERTLVNVLNIGMMKTRPNEYRTDEDPPKITYPLLNLRGLEISTTPSNWTGLTVKEIVRLDLNPDDMSEFERKSAEARKKTPYAYQHNAGYFKTVFKSPYSEYRFFVENLGPKRDEEIAYYVLARPPSDLKIYVR
jgi:hypothetical protein